METRKKFTMSDVAKLGGVSIATVSRVISNKPGVGEETRSRITALLSELDYYPSVLAQSLAVKKSNTLGLVIPRDASYVFSNPYYLEMLRGITEEANKLNYRLLMSVGTNGRIQAYDEFYKNGTVDGLIITSALYKDKRIAKLIYDGYPFSLIGRFDTEMLPTGRQNIVDINHIKAACSVTNYLISLGHKRIAHITGSLDYYLTLHRLQGYKEALTSSQIEIRDEYISVQEGFMQQDGKTGMNKLLELAVKPTAVFVFNDLMALGVMQAIKEHGMHIPDDISVIGFDDILTAPFLQPGLSSVQHFPYKKAALATSLLVTDLQGFVNQTRDVEIQYEIIKRESCRRI